MTTKNTEPTREDPGEEPELLPHQKILVKNIEAAALCSMSLSTFQKKVAAGDLPPPCIKNDKGTGNRWSVLQLRQHHAPNLNY